MTSAMNTQPTNQRASGLYEYPGETRLLVNSKADSVEINLQHGVLKALPRSRWRTHGSTRKKPRAVVHASWWPTATTASR
jgi:hypothetical protein